jgi:hypothetical protein
MSNKLAMIAPVHFPKIKWLDNICSSYFINNADIDLYFVISEEELDKFKDYFNLYDQEKFIVCPNVNSSRNPITYKKMFGLHTIFQKQKYKGYACIDIDSEFIKSGLEESFDKFCANKEIICYPTDVDFLINIQKISSKYFPENDELKKFKTLYSVWNTIPWYINDNLDDFFKDVKYDTHKFFDCEWEVFDHICYQSWLLYKNIFKISPIQFRLEYPEDMPEAQRDVFKHYKVDWVRYGSRNLSCFINQSPLMYFHVDRDQG